MSAAGRRRTSSATNASSMLAAAFAGREASGPSRRESTGLESLPLPRSNAPPLLGVAEPPWKPLEALPSLRRECVEALFASTAVRVSECRPQPQHRTESLREYRGRYGATRAADACAIS